MALSLSSSINQPLPLPAPGQQTALRGASVTAGSVENARVVAENEDAGGTGSRRSQSEREDARVGSVQPRAARERQVPLQTGSVLALALAEEQNLSRQQSLALGSYLQTQALVPLAQNTGRELIVGVDTFV